MWLKLGKTEVINLDYVSAIRKNPETSGLDIVYHDLKNIKALSFGSAEERDKAFNAIIENLNRARMVFE